MVNRRAAHAGSWYEGHGKSLNVMLERWLEAPTPSMAPARAIISPHAGYSFCGKCAAFSYKQIVSKDVKRVFILGPSHHVYLDGCAVSRCSKYETPLGDLTIDKQTNKELLKNGNFSEMEVGVDEDEHSIEMQLPFIYKVMEENPSYTIVPVLVGSIGKAKEQLYGKIFAKYLSDPANLFVISSDFCHWGKRFRFTAYDKSKGDIFQSIEHMDRMGMKFIENLDPSGFYDYLKECGNTICGRHPIAVLLNAIDEIRKSSELGSSFKSPQVKFLSYSQSSQVVSPSDSSVSYAAAALVTQR
eukprot:Nk52_evm1s2127 gene=Nk52_evmTU1s2127